MTDKDGQVYYFSLDIRVRPVFLKDRSMEIIDDIIFDCHFLTTNIANLKLKRTTLNETANCINKDITICR